MSELAPLYSIWIVSTATLVVSIITLVRVSRVLPPRQPRPPRARSDNPSAARPIAVVMFVGLVVIAVVIGLHVA